MKNVDFFRLCENFTFEVQKALFSIQNIKECFFLAFLARKKTYEKRSIFWQKPWTNPFAKERFFFDFVRTSLLRSKELFFLSRISKNVSLWLFLLKKKNIWEKRSMFWQKPWTNLFAKCRFSSTLWELHFWGPKNFMFFPEYQKMFLMAFFAKKKNIWEKGRFFDKNHGLTPLQNVDFFYFARILLFGSKKHSLLTRIKKMFLSGFFG